MLASNFDLALGILWYVAFVFSVVLHEAAHAFTSWSLGDPTAYHGGQVTLDPIPHMRREPIGMILVPILALFLSGFAIGWASAPYNFFWAQRFPKRAALMAAAGPLANLLLCFVAALVMRAGLELDLLDGPRPDAVGGWGFHNIVSAGESGLPAALAAFLSILFSLNLILFVFNLIPVPPLDGGSILPNLLLPERMARSYQRIVSEPMWSLLGILVAWRFFLPLFLPVYTFALSVLFAS